MLRNPKYCPSLETHLTRAGQIKKDVLIWDYPWLNEMQHSCCCTFDFNERKGSYPTGLACSAELTSSDWSLTQLICSAIWVVPFKTVRIFDENTNQKVTMSKHNVRCVGILGKFWLTISWPLILGWPPPYPLFGIGFWSNKKATFMLFWQHSDFEFYFHLVWVRDFFWSMTRLEVAYHLAAYSS